MVRNRIALILVGLLAVSIAGCGGDKKKESSPSMEMPKTSYLVSVNDELIGDKELAQELAMLRQQMSGRVSSDQLRSMEPMLKRQAVANLVNRMLLEQAADKENIAVTTEQIEAKYEEIKSNFPDEESFEAQLDRSGISKDEFRVEIEKGIKLEELIDLKTADIAKPTEEEAKEFYDSNIMRFSTAERIRASHILIKVEETDTDLIRNEKRERAEKLQGEILAGADMAALAMQYSDCPSKSKGGDLGYFSRGQMVKPFEDAAFAHEIGKISPVVETRFGYHIIKVTEKEDASVTSFEDARDSIIDYLAEMKKQDVMNEIVNSLRDGASIVYADTTLAPAN